MDIEHNYPPALKTAGCATNLTVYSLYFWLSLTVPSPCQKLSITYIRNICLIIVLTPWIHKQVIVYDLIDIFYDLHYAIVFYIPTS